MSLVFRPDVDWLHHASTVGVDGIADAVLDACAVRGGVARPSSQRILVSEPEGGWANPRLLGWVHEWSTTSTERSSRGAYYTPPDFAAAVLDTAMAGSDLPHFTVDPACGGGVFLLEILDRLLEAGVAAEDCVARVAGIEINPGAAAVARLSLRAWQLSSGVAQPGTPRVSVGDSLDRWPSSWPAADLIVGNPPFASPLKSGAIPASAAAYRNHHSEVLGPYADLAAIHLWRASQMLHDGGRLAFVAPVSIVNARDTGRLWERFEAEADAVRVLIPESNPFEASVRVFVPVFEMRRQAASERRSLPHAVGEAIGLPALPDLESAPTLGSICDATSGFRDEFYGLAEVVGEESTTSGGDLRKLVTVGSINPLSCSWGRRATRFAKAKWDRPVVDPSKLEGKVAGFVAGQGKPKVLVATQTKVLEPVLDPVGDVVGVTPTIVVTGAQPAHVAAVLLAPPVNAIAVQRWFGTGLSDTALRPTASTLLELPLPDDGAAWNAAANLIEAHAPAIDGSQTDPDPEVLEEIASLMNSAYGADTAVLAWWLKRAGLG
ncbi:MAG: N-6 DNA methylase [Acidimicrobiales bacterium]